MCHNDTEVDPTRFLFSISSSCCMRRKNLVICENFDDKLKKKKIKLSLNWCCSMPSNTMHPNSYGVSSVRQM